MEGVDDKNIVSKELQDEKQHKEPKGRLGRKEISDMLKFYQASVITTAEVGGTHLLAPVYSQLGVNLGKFYLKKGANAVEALKFFVQGMGGEFKTEPPLKESADPNDLVGKTVYSVPFKGRICPIGGEASTKRYRVGVQQKQKYEVFSEGLCIPYLKGFLLAFGLGSEVTSKSCILNKDCPLKDESPYCNFEIKITSYKPVSKS